MITRAQMRAALGRRVSLGEYERRTTQYVTRQVPAGRRWRPLTPVMSVRTIARQSPKWMRKHADTFGDNYSRRSRYERYDT